MKALNCVTGERKCRVWMYEWIPFSPRLLTLPLMCNLKQSKRFCAAVIFLGWWCYARIFFEILEVVGLWGHVCVSRFESQRNDWWLCAGGNLGWKFTLSCYSSSSRRQVEVICDDYVELIWWLQYLRDTRLFKYLWSYLQKSEKNASPFPSWREALFANVWPTPWKASKYHFKRNKLKHYFMCIVF